MQTTETKSRPADLLTRSLVVLDAGNRHVQWLDPSGVPRTIRATIAELDEWQDAGYSEDVILIEVGDRRFVLGSSTGMPIYKAEKSELASIVALAALEPNIGSNVLAVNCLRILCTDSRSAKYKEMAKAVELFDFLGSDRTFRRNGQTISLATIRKVELVDECAPPYRWAMRHKLFASPEKFNGVLDVGGGDSTARIFDSNGTIQREYDKVLPGTKALATAIAAAILKDFQYTPDTGVIMDAIADGSLAFEANFQRVCFQKQFDRELAKWVEALRMEIADAWNGLLSSGRVGEVLIVGGSAPLLQGFEARTGGRFKVLRHEAIKDLFASINVYGMGMDNA